MSKKLHSNASTILFETAGELRKNQTKAEEILWNYLITRPLGFINSQISPFRGRG
jgi:very-short-patch-repair endonuclease